MNLSGLIYLIIQLFLSLFGDFNKFLNLLVQQETGLMLADYHHFDILISRFYHIQ